MLPLVLAAGVVFCLFIVLGLRADGSPAPPKSPLGDLRPGALIRLVQRVLARRGVATRVVRLEKAGADLEGVHQGPLGEQKLYVRVAFPASGVVDEAEVQATLDTARSEAGGRGYLFSAGSFDDEARASAADSALELVDGRKLAQLAQRPTASV